MQVVDLSALQTPPTSTTTIERSEFDCGGIGPASAPRATTNLFRPFLQPDACSWAAHDIELKIGVQTQQFKHMPWMPGSRKFQRPRGFLACGWTACATQLSPKDFASGTTTNLTRGKISTNCDSTFGVLCDDQYTEPSTYTPLSLVLVGTSVGGMS